MHSTAFFRDTSDLADFCAQLVVKGIRFNVQPANGGYEVELTGF